MRSENMSKSLLTAYHITEVCSFYRKSRSSNTMVTADFGPETALTPFLLMRAKEIAKSLGKCIPMEELFPIEENRGRRSEWQRQVFERKLLNSRFRACAVKIVL